MHHKGFWYRNISQDKAHCIWQKITCDKIKKKNSIQSANSYSVWTLFLCCLSYYSLFMGKLSYYINREAEWSFKNVSSYVTSPQLLPSSLGVKEHILIIFCQACLVWPLLSLWGNFPSQLFPSFCFCHSGFPRVLRTNQVRFCLLLSYLSEITSLIYLHSQISHLFPVLTQWSLCWTSNIK